MICRATANASVSKKPLRTQVRCGPAATSTKSNANTRPCLRQPERLRFFIFWVKPRAPHWHRGSSDIPNQTEGSWFFHGFKIRASPTNPCSPIAYRAYSGEGDPSHAAFRCYVIVRLAELRCAPSGRHAFGMTRFGFEFRLGFFLWYMSIGGCAGKIRLDRFQFRAIRAIGKQSAEIILNQP